VADREAALLRARVALRVAVISSSPLVRAGLQAALAQAGGFEVVVAASSIAETSSAAQAPVDVIVAELGDGTDEAGLAHADEAVPPLVLLIDGGDGPPAEWLAEGVTLLPRDAPGALIAAAAAAAAAGLVATSRELMAQALRDARLPGTASTPSHERLTAREAQVLEKLALGMGNKAIAQTLHISTHTAKFHVAQIIAKLDATSRAHAVAKALRGGLLEA
jgi:DNA-binding NarL/FixJ family response regulator